MCLKSCQRKFSMPARFKAFLHASVLAQEIGRPRHVNTRSECFPSCRRNTFTAVALSGTAIGLRFSVYVLIPAGLAVLIVSIVAQLISNKMAGWGAQGTIGLLMLMNAVPPGFGVYGPWYRPVP